jgi:hypothetical protein
MHPDTPERLKEARRLDREGESGRAVLAYRLVLRMDPDCLDAQVDLAGLLMTLGRQEEALALCREVLAARPGSPSALQNMVGALLGLERYEEAEAHCRALLEVDPSWAPAHLGIGLGLAVRGHYPEAEASLLRAQALDPGNPRIRSAILGVQVKLRAWDRVYPTWMAIAKGDMEGARSEFERAFVHLTYGELQEGWRAYESRFTPPNTVAPNLQVPQPFWDGAPFPGRTLLLHYEQGFGDTLQFIRYAQMAKARGGTVVAVVQPQLLAVLQGCPGVDAFCTFEGPIPPFDLHLPLLSLPGVLGTRLDTIPAPIPYLRIPENPSPAEDLVRPSPNLKVALVWAGSLGFKYEFARTVPPPALAPLAGIPGVDWYSVQVGFDGGVPWEGVTDLAPRLKDFTDTARVLSRMDLLLTTDTSVAHLAGALGLPAWVMLCILPDWRWFLEGDRTPWYPAFRLFRQRTYDDWSGVVGEVAASLKALLNGHRGTC